MKLVLFVALAALLATGGANAISTRTGRMRQLAHETATPSDYECSCTLHDLGGDDGQLVNAVCTRVADSPTLQAPHCNCLPVPDFGFDCSSTAKSTRQSTIHSHEAFSELCTGLQQAGVADAECVPITTPLTCGANPGSQRVVSYTATDAATCSRNTAYKTCTVQGPACPVTAVNCVWNDWTEWGACSVSCGDGTQTRSRSVHTPAAGGGQPCAGESTESRACSLGACPPAAVNCAVSEWSEWTTCSATCGGGTQSHTRTVTTQPANGGTACPNLSETRPCGESPCPPAAVNCAVSDWSEWTTCSATCGGGHQSHTRTVTTQPANGGTACPNLSETRPCGESPCPPAAVNCAVSEWSEWTTCSATCGGGHQSHTRTVTTQPANGGTACPNLSETRPCGESPCPSNPPSQPPSSPPAHPPTSCCSSSPCHPSHPPCDDDSWVAPEIVEHKPACGETCTH